MEGKKLYTLEYGLDCSVMDSTTYLLSSAPEQERCWYFGWLQLLDVWFLLHAWHYLQHVFKSKYIFWITVIVAILTTAGFIMQRVQLLPRIAHTIHSNKDFCRTDILVPEETYKKFNREDGSQYISSRIQTFCMELKTEMQNLHAEYEMTINKFNTEFQTWKKVIRKYVDEIKSLQYLKVEASQMENSQSLNNVLSEASIQKQIEDEIARYDADKLGVPDYALESSGGSIVATPNTKNYDQKTWITLWGINLFQTGTGCPRNIIQGLKHDSADAVHLGFFTYNKNGSPRQTFEVIPKDRTHTFQAVELSVLSNHGNPDYTCIYRFRVHGQLYSEPQSHF